MNEFDENNTAMEQRNEGHVATPAMLPMTEMQARLAADRPRDEMKVFNGALAELSMMPDYAEEAYYSIPYKDKSGGVEKVAMVEGLSIKAAMGLARRWGNCANGARIADDRDDRVICQGMFIDYETNVLTLRDMSVSKTAKRRDGGFYRLSADRMNLAILAGQSKAVRNAILATLPTPLKEAYFEKAKQLAVAPPPKKDQKEKTIQERISAGKSYFVKEWKAEQKEIDGMISEWIADADGNLAETEILHRLIGLKNALKDGQVTIDAALGRKVEPGTSMPQEKK